MITDLCRRVLAEVGVRCGRLSLREALRVTRTRGALDTTGGLEGERWLQCQEILSADLSQISWMSDALQINARVCGRTRIVCMGLVS